MNEGEQRRNILIFVGLGAVLLLSVAAIYLTFFRGSPENGNGAPTFGQESGERAGESEDNSDINSRRNRTEWDKRPPRLIQITNEPVSGATFLDGEDLVVRYAERQTSHIYDVAYDTFDDERISNETIPGVYEALFTANGDGVIFRYLAENNKTIRTYTAELVERENPGDEQTPYALEGEFLPNNITHVALSPDKEQIFWMTEALRDSSWFVSNTDGTSEKEVFGSDFTEWLPQWQETGAVSMTTKPSGHVAGQTYVFDIAGRSFEKVGDISDVHGLTTTTSPGGTYIFYSEANDEGLERSRVLNTETGEVGSLFMRTIADKCAWSPAEAHILYCGVPDSVPDGAYPDMWYQGRTLFTDTIWEINAETGSAQEIYSPREQDNETIDIYRPTVSNDGSHIVFNNKRDMSLWSFRIEDDPIVTPEQIPEGAPGI